MFVCVCNGLNERAVHEARNQGACTARDVHRHHGTTPQCGMCMKTIGDMVCPNAPAERAEAGSALVAAMG